MYTISEDLQFEVSKGALWMDENHPNWAAKIDLSRLNMNNCYDCIIGQAIGNYFDEIYKLDNIGDYGDADDWAIEHGFNAIGDDDENQDTNEYRQLEALWTYEVKKRLN
jgi:hypothetical protein